jgi:hypothetical protein
MKGDQLLMRHLMAALCIFLLMGFAPAAFGASINLTGTIRDFNDTHPDFKDGLGVDPGIVETTLGVDKKPVYAGSAGNPTTHGETAFNQWYRNVGGVNTMISIR